MPNMTGGVTGYGGEFGPLIAAILARRGMPALTAGGINIADAAPAPAAPGLPGGSGLPFGQEDTRFMGPQGQQAPMADFARAMVPTVPGQSVQLPRFAGTITPGQEDTRFMGPQGQQAPAMDLAGTTLPTGGSMRLPPIAAKQGGGDMDPERRLRLLRAARMFREGASEFRNVTSPGELLLTGKMPERRVVDQDLRAEEERVRRGDFENPASPASQMLRRAFGQMTGQEIPDTVPATAIMGISPVLDRLARTQLAGQTQLFNQALRLEGEKRAQRGEQRQEEGLGIQRERLEMAKKPTPAQAEKIAQIEMTMKALKKLMGTKAAYNTGPISNAFEEVLTFIGASEFDALDLSKKNAFKSDVHDMLAQYMQSISGQAISEKEAIRLQKAFPKVSDDDKTFVEKAKNALARLEEKRTVYLDALEKSGKDVSALRAGGGIEETAPESGPGGISVIGKDGKVHGPFPKAQAEHYLQTGEAVDIYHG